MRLYFVRHGESRANIANEFSVRNHEKHPLTPKGIRQAEALAEKLRGTRFSEIYASPMLRARQTAEILNAPHGLDIIIAPALQEHDAGDLEGRRDPEAWQAYQELFETWLVKQDLDARMPNGESFNQLRARFVPFLESVIQKHAGTDANVILVGHAGIFHALLPLLLSNVGYAFGYQHLLGNTALVIAEPRENTIYCLEWDGVSLNETKQNEI